MTYKEALISSMDEFFKDPLARLVGYGLRNGKGGNGTLKMVPNEKVVETPVAENLMAGVAMGLAMKGLRPLLFVERSDFLANAADCIVNHLDKARFLSRGEFSPCIIIRVVIGNKTKPLFTGPTHTQDFAPAFREMVEMPVYSPETPEDICDCYRRAIRDQFKGIGSSMIFEKKDSL